jgi:hypothetical protein
MNIRSPKGRFLLFLVSPILALLACCSYRKAGAFPFNAETGTGPRGPVLYGLSKNAAAGVLPPGESRPLEYEFDNPVTGPAESSLEISYRLNAGNAGNSGQWQGGFILETGSLSWELPADLSFLKIEELAAADSATGGPAGELPRLIRYSVPLTGSGTLERISIRREDSGARGNAPELAILGMRLRERWYGFAAEEPPAGTGGGGAVSLTPFVYYRAPANGGGGVAVDPPGRFRPDPGTGALSVRASGGGITAEAGGPGGERLLLEARPELTGIDVPGLWPFAFPLYLGGRDLSSAVFRSAPVGEGPIAADPGLILSWPGESWKEKGFTVFRWDAFPQVLIFDTASYAVQDRLFKRLAFFVEKRGFRGRLAGDGEIASLHGWNAHDYRAASLAAFFAAAEETAFPLLPEERELRALLLDTGVLARQGGKIIAGTGAVISISRESEEYLRRRFMAHEGFHGIFFIDEDFRDFSRRRWETLPEPARRFILSYFDFQAYDISDGELMINELMAHVLQEGEAAAGAYFGETLPNRMIARSPWRESALPAESRVNSRGVKYWPALEQAFRAEAEAFSAYVRRRWGLSAGRVWRMSLTVQTTSAPPGTRSP